MFRHAQNDPKMLHLMGILSLVFNRIDPIEYSRIAPPSFCKLQNSFTGAEAKYAGDQSDCMIF